MDEIDHNQERPTQNRRVLFAIVTVSILLVGLLSLMGLFSSLFRNKITKAEVGGQSIGVPAHQEDWAAYLSTIDNDKVGSVVVDLGLKSIAPLKDKLIRLRIDIKMQGSNSDGLPLPQEFERLNEIEEKMKAALINNGAIHAGHLYCQGEMSLYEYLGNTDRLEAVVSETMSAYPNYKYEYKFDREENWESYSEFLYPLPIQMQSIHNQKVIAQLKANGDNLEIKRPVNHLIYFKTESDIDKFLVEIKGKGFKVVKKEKVDEGEYQLLLMLEREDRVDSQSVDDYVLYLWQKAHDADGDYDGWGSSIVK